MNSLDRAASNSDGDVVCLITDMFLSFEHVLGSVPA